MERITGKRIVSRGEYLKAVGEKMVLQITSLTLFLVSGFYGIASVCLLLLLLIALVVWAKGLSPGVLLLWMNTTTTPFAFVIAVIGVGLARPIFLAAKKSKAQADSMIIDMVPLNRANTANLPVPDSLVRASSEPPQAQQAVLLRAAAEGQETPPEEMLRAANGPG